MPPQPLITWHRALSRYKNNILGNVAGNRAMYARKCTFGSMKALPIVFRSSLLLAYAFFCYLMLEITLQYIPLNTDVAFLRIKQDYVGMAHYRWAFFIHAYTAMLVLPAGFTQFSGWLRKRHRMVHRTGGWVYVATVLLAAGPSGLVIGVYANGGLPSQIAFCLLAVLWMLFTVLAIVRLRQHNYQAHRWWMIRSFALALSAITLRAWKYVLVALFHPRPMDVYLVVAWLGWVGNLAVAEYIIYRLKKNNSKIW